MESLIDLVTGIRFWSPTRSRDSLLATRGRASACSTWAFATLLPKPAVAAVINLKSSCDFDNPEGIAGHAHARIGWPGVSLDTFRFIVANHRYVYHFDTWPQVAPDLEFPTQPIFLLISKATEKSAEKVTVTATNES